MKIIEFTGSATAALAISLCISTSANAHDVRADDHAPIGVMGDHAHKKGEIMFSLRHMHMEMSGNQIGTDDITPDEIATTVANIFAGMPGMPPTLRLVPTESSMDMTMIGAMYAPDDRITFMAGVSYIQKKMQTTTYQGGMGTNVLGSFSPNPKGFGDVKVSAIFPLLGHAEKMADSTNELNLKATISLPTGSIDETVEVLTPMGMTAENRAPYKMQPGSGTWDLQPSLTYKAIRGKIGFGVQAAAKIRLGTNDNGWALGDQYEATGWVSYRADQAVSFSLRSKYSTQSQIEGMDPMVMGPVQSANTAFSGGDKLELLLGVNFIATHGALAGHRLALEVGKPIYQDLNGPQLASDWMLTVGWQKAW